MTEKELEYSRQKSVTETESVELPIYTIQYVGGCRGPSTTIYRKLWYHEEEDVFKTAKVTVNGDDQVEVKTGEVTEPLSNIWTPDGADREKRKEQFLRAARKAKSMSAGVLRGVKRDHKAQQQDEGDDEQE